MVVEEVVGVQSLGVRWRCEWRSVAPRKWNHRGCGHLPMGTCFLGWNRCNRGHIHRSIVPLGLNRCNRGHALQCCTTV